MSKMKHLVMVLQCDDCGRTLRAIGLHDEIQCPFCQSDNFWYKDEYFVEIIE